MFLLANLGAEIQRLADALHKGDRELSNRHLLVLKAF